MLEIGRWTWNVLTWFFLAPCTVGLMAGDTQCWPGACPSDGIYIRFGFPSGFGVLWFGVCSADRGTVLQTSRPLHCHGVCEISLWLVGYVLSRSASDFGQVSGLVRVSLVGQAPELWNLHMYVNSHDQNIFLYFCFCSESLLFACSIMICHVGNKLYWIELNWIDLENSHPSKCFANLVVKINHLISCQITLCRIMNKKQWSYNIPKLFSPSCLEQWYKYVTQCVTIYILHTKLDIG